MTTKLKPTFLARYLAGEHERVWSELRKLGKKVHAEPYYDDAWAVACETMRRVRQNVRTIHRRLAKLGYKFLARSRAWVPPAAEAPKLIARVERTIGPLPLSLRAFYLIVGSVDFRQSRKQFIHGHYPHRRGDFVSVPELRVLGEADPLVIWPLKFLIEEGQTRPAGLYCCFAPDECHKANYSGGENYHVYLPNPSADVRIEGMYGIKETIVEHLRYCCRWGGFRGPLRASDTTCWKVAPNLQIISKLAAGLAEI
jgi:hypothetical protein